MKKIIAIITIGAATASLQLNAQDTKPTEEQVNPEIKTDVLDERAQPAADYQHNQYGTYPQGEESEVLPQTRTEISKDALPKGVLSSFENSEYGDQEIVAVYEVKEDASEMQQLSNDPSEEPISDPTYHNDLNERSNIESSNSADNENMEEMISTTQTETNLSKDIKEGNTINPRPSDTKMPQDVSTTSVMYEIEVEGEDANTTLTYSEEGELKNTSEESDM